VSDDKDAGEKAKELLVYGPIGLALYLRDTAPSFLRLFVSRGRNEFDQRKRGVTEQIDQAKAVGENTAAFGGPHVLRLVSDGIAAVRERAEEALGALGVLAGDDGFGSDIAAAGHDSVPTSSSSTSTLPNATAFSSVSTVSSQNASVGLALADYDDLSASQVVDRLEGLSAADLEAIRAYEAEHRARNTILGKIELLTQGP
jgi:hypothetical protein